MKPTFILLSLLIAQSGWSKMNDCKLQLSGLMKTKSEKYLFEKYHTLMERYGIDCKKGDYGNNLLAFGAWGFIHEVAHQEDLGGLNINYSSPELNLYTINDEHIGKYENTENIPAPANLINPYIQENNPHFLDEDSPYSSMNSGYMLDDLSSSSDDLFFVASEINAYSHGTLVEKRLQPLRPETVTIKDENGFEYVTQNLFKNISIQTEGLLYFIYNHNLYLNLLKNNYPKKWKEFYSEDNKIFMKNLMNAALKALLSTKHCNSLESQEVLNFYIKELRKQDLEILTDYLGHEKVNKLLCIEVNDIVKTVEASNALSFIDNKLNSTNKKVCE